MKINLQQKTKAEKGTVEMYWFENEFVGLEKTLFHRIAIPLSPFDSGLDYESQPITTSICFDWLVLSLENPKNLNSLLISSQKYEKLETSVYLGGAHNWCDVNSLFVKKIEGDLYFVDAEIVIDFEHEGVAENEIFTFSTTIEFKEDIEN